jgi:hypothetical protein
MNEMDDITTSEPTLSWPAAPLPADLACEHCGAALDEQQRYCIACGGRRSDADNPAGRYFAAAARRDRSHRLAAEPASPVAGGLPRVAAALVLAVLPLAVGVGVLLGRGNDASVDPRLLAALRAQPAQVVAAGPTGASGTAGAAPAKATKTAGGGQVLSRTSFGAAHQIAGYNPNAAQVRQDNQVVKRINSQVGKSYVNAQKNLPDAIAVGGGGSSTNAGPSQGPGQP